MRKMEFKSFSQYLTEAKGEVYFVFGRFNPPTSGHEKLFNKLKKTAGSNPYRIYGSKSQDPKKNPLSFKDKVKFLRKMFPKHARSVMADADVRTALDICVKLYGQGFTSVTMIAGSDRLKEFDTLLNKYNGVDSRHGFYNFEKGIKVVSAGERDPDAEGVAGMSASKLRAYASDNDLENFTKGMPQGYKDSKALFNTIRKGMGLKETHMHRKHVELEPVSEQREKFIEGELFKPGDEVVLKETNQIGVIQRCGTNFLVVEFGEWKKRVWLDDVEHLEEKKYSDMNAKQKAAHDKERPNAPESDHTKRFKEFNEIVIKTASGPQGSSKVHEIEVVRYPGLGWYVTPVDKNGYEAWHVLPQSLKWESSGLYHRLKSEAKKDAEYYAKKLNVKVVYPK